MLDVLVKTTILAAVVAALTRRSGPATAAAAHRLWLLTLLSPLWVLAANGLSAPIAFVVPRTGSFGSVLAAAATEWTFALALAYGAISVVLLARTAIGLGAVHRLVRGARPVTGSALLRLRLLAGDHGLTVCEAALPVPVSAGAWRTCVILPAGWRDFPVPALTAILRHEAAHVRRRDCALALAAAVLEALFWWVPAVWVASSRLRWFAEMACDADAARGMARGEYAAELLALSAGWAGVRSPRHAIAAGAETNLASRIRLLIDGMDGGRRRAWLPIALVVLVLAGLLSAGVRFSASGSPVQAVWDFDHGPSHGHLHGH